MRKILNNKKGQGMTIGTLVVIVLAVIVLVVVALGFGTGWSTLWGKMTGYFSPTNVDSSKQACTYACTTQASYDYCCGVKDVKFAKNEDSKPQTCGELGSTCGEFTCINTLCGELVCNDDVKPESGASACPDNQKLDKKVLDTNLKAIPDGQVCCAGTPPTGTPPTGTPSTTPTP